MLNFIFETCSHKAVSCTPSRLSRLERCMVRLNVKEVPYRKLWRLNESGRKVYYDSNAYTAPLQVLRNGSVRGYDESKQSPILTLNDELNGIIDRLSDGIISNKEALTAYYNIKEYFSSFSD